MVELAKTGSAASKPTSHTDAKHSDGPNEKTANKGAANGYAGLTASPKIALAQLQEVLAHIDLTDSPPDAHHVAFVQADADALYDALGGLATHVAAGDPHSVYLTQAEADALYDILGGLAAHVAAGDPHPGYRLESVAIKVKNAITIPVKKPLPGVTNDAAEQPLSAPFALANCTKLKARARSNLGTTATFRVTIAGTDRGSVTITSGNSVGTATVTAFSIAEDDEVDIDLTAGGTDDVAVAVTVIGEQETF